MLTTVRNFLKEEDGVGSVEMILILCVLVGLVALFKDNMESVMSTVMKNITKAIKSL